MVYGQISLGYLIRKVMRDLKPGGDNWISDAVEWSGEALEAIGRGAQYEFVNDILNVKNFTTSLPIGLNRIEMLAYDKQWRNEKQIENYTEPLAYATASFPRQLFTENFAGFKTKSNHNFVIQGRYIKTSFEKGCIAIAYERMALDEKGWPLMPDDVSFKQAIYWYIVMKMMEGGMNHPHLNYLSVRQIWLHYAGQASDNAAMPDIPQMENFLNQWVSLIPNISERDTMFEHLGAREDIDRDYLRTSGWGNHPVSSDVIYGMREPQ